MVSRPGPQAQFYACPGIPESILEEHFMPILSNPKRQNASRIEWAETSAIFLF